MGSTLVERSAFALIASDFFHPDAAQGFLYCRRVEGRSIGVLFDHVPVDDSPVESKYSEHGLVFPDLVPDVQIESKC